MTNSKNYSHRTFLLLICLLASLMQIKSAYAQADSTFTLEISNRKTSEIQLTPDSLIIDTSFSGFRFYRDSVNLLILDSATALAVAEAILFNVYGKENIIMQRPYVMHRSNFYWELQGTLPPNYHGGVFEIILDARDSRIVYMTHGK